MAQPFSLSRSAETRHPRAPGATAEYSKAVAVPAIRSLAKILPSRRQLPVYFGRQHPYTLLQLSRSESRMRLYWQLGHAQ